MQHHRRRSWIGTIALTWAVAAYGATGPAVAPAAGSTALGPPALPLDLQVRSSGLPGGYVWLSPADHQRPGRWHTFGMAEFLYVTCPEPFEGTGSGYEIAVFDPSCQLLGRVQTPGGQLLLEIEADQPVRLIDAPPIQDWLPSDSMPAESVIIPCVAP